MAWIETRGTRTPVHRVRWREHDRVEEESFDSRADADLYRQLVEQAGSTRPGAPTASPAPSSPRTSTAVLHASSPAAGCAPVAGQLCSFADWAGYWLSGLSGLRPRTLADYRRGVERDFVPVFGDLDLASIDRTVIGSWVTGLAEEGLSAKTIRNKHGLLFQVFEAATLHEPEPLRSRNPCRGNRLPRVWKPAIRTLTPTEFHGLLRCVEPFYRPVVEMLAATGLRWGELTGLQTRYVDLLGRGARRARLDVEWTLQRSPGAYTGYVLGRPKSPAAQRSVPLPPRAVDLLLSQLAGKGSSDLVFTTPAGGEIRHQNFYTRIWRPAIHKAGLGEIGPLPALRIHDLRHSYVAWQLDANPTEGTLYKISKWLGHESFAFTVDRYGYLLPQDATIEMAAIQAALTVPPDDAEHGLLIR
jgi:integrase